MNQSRLGLYGVIVPHLEGVGTDDSLQRKAGYRAPGPGAPLQPVGGIDNARDGDE